MSFGFFLVSLVVLITIRCNSTTRPPPPPPAKLGSPPASSPPAPAPSKPAASGPSGHFNFSLADAH
jgi:hypothetical protein